MREALGLRRLQRRRMPLPEIWSSLRDRLTTSAEFRRRASANPLTRHIARRRARALFDLCAGFVYSQVLLACVRLRLFDALTRGPLGVDEIARRHDFSVEAAERLLRAAAALQLVERRGERYGLGPLGSAMVDNPGLAAMVEHHTLLYADLRDPVALLRGENGTTELGGYWPYAGAGGAGSGKGETHAYTALMAASQPLVAAEVLDACPLHKHTCLLDVGGGDGSFVTAAAARAPHLRFIVFDLPTVAERARARLLANGLSSRAMVIEGNFLSDPLPKGADIASLVRVLHDHNDHDALRILAAVRTALMPGGRVLIAEPMSQTPGAEPVGDAYFGFYLMAMGSGRPRTQAEIAQLLEHAGFENPQSRKSNIPLVASVMMARAPADMC
jgi:demethylspheroidene O-methyltransferase